MDNLEAAKKRALRILGKRNFSEREMQKRLVSKGETQEIADETVQWLVQLGYIDDSDYATRIVSHYSAKGYGISRIKDELYKRGIPRDMWDDKLYALDDEDMFDAAVEFLRKKLKGSNEGDDLKRASDALVRRGFSYEDVRIAASKYLENIDE